MFNPIYSPGMTIPDAYLGDKFKPPIGLEQKIEEAENKWIFTSSHDTVRVHPGFSEYGFIMFYMFPQISVIRHSFWKYTFFGGHLSTDPSIATPSKIEICSQDVDMSQVFYLFVGC